MDIWPAIDLRGGKCVRLQQGDYGRETIFGDDPLAIARRWVEEGADRLHLVDLDGARDGVGQNREIVSAIVREIRAPCQLGGGIRDELVIADWLQRGVARLVVGTRAVKDPEWFRAMCRQFPGRLVLGVDARDGLVATNGWHEQSRTTATELVGWFHGEPLAGVVYTDIARDGMLQGPNFDSVRQLAEGSSFPVIASGGVATADDIARLAELPVEGCIVGRAIYEGTLTLAEALKAARDTNTH
jgi:phosphoribosylformimino-5-aminoimidazole carboxamide ribotide isomerase